MFLIVLPDIPTEDMLMRRLKAGDNDAMIEVYNAYFPAVYQYTRLKVGDATLAEDIASDVFVKLIMSVSKRSAPSKSLRGWLFRVARNEIANHYGRPKQLPLADLEEWMPAPAESNPDLHLADVIDIERVRHAVRMLTADHQEILILRFGQRLSLKECADIMGKSVSAIKSLQFRALDTLRMIIIGEG